MSASPTPSVQMSQENTVNGLLKLEWHSRTLVAFAASGQAGISFKPFWAAFRARVQDQNFLLVRLRMQDRSLLPQLKGLHLTVPVH